MSKEETYEELMESFSKSKKELQFKSSFEELEEVFLLKDDALGNGFISDNYSRQICSRICDKYYLWYNKLHSIIMPDPGSMINMTENQAFTDQEKNDINLIMNKIMAHINKNNVLVITKDKNEESKFIDESLRFWNEDLEEKLKFIMDKIQETWEKYSLEENMRD